MIRIFGLRILTSKGYLANLGEATTVGYQLGWEQHTVAAWGHASLGGIEFSKNTLMEQQIEEILAKEAQNG